MRNSGSSCIVRNLVLLAKGLPEVVAGKMLLCATGSTGGEERKREEFRRWKWLQKLMTFAEVWPGNPALEFPSSRAVPGIGYGFREAARFPGMEPYADSMGFDGQGMQTWPSPTRPLGTQGSSRVLDFQSRLDEGEERAQDRASHIYCSLLSDRVFEQTQKMKETMVPYLEGVRVKAAVEGLLAQGLQGQTQITLQGFIRRRERAADRLGRFFRISKSVFCGEEVEEIAHMFLFCSRWNSLWAELEGKFLELGCWPCCGAGCGPTAIS
ncbi:hypothetical protein R1sor_004379 [Riccia sorocarpa]|uniref:Uncharacterized protein n=1 Tax=Riccia sorocarpa TaxID=122646 RepID=A0ABD3HH49_9MARC